MKKIVIFGAGGTGKRIAYEVSQYYEILCFIDSDPRKWGGI